MSPSVHSSWKWRTHYFCILKATAPKLSDWWIIFKADCERLQICEISRIFLLGNKISGQFFAAVNVLCWLGHPKLCPSSKTSSKKKTKMTYFLTAKLCMKSSQRTKNLSRTDSLLFTSQREARMTGSQRVLTKIEFFMWKMEKLRLKEPPP